MFRGIRNGESNKLDLSKPVVLYGKSGKAKTDFAMAQFKCPLLIDEPDKIKEITPSNDGLVFDDMNFGPSGLNFSCEKIIHLLDMKKTRTFRMRYFNGKIPAGMKRIFCTNLIPPEERKVEPAFFMSMREQFGDEVDETNTAGPQVEWIFPRSTNEQQNIAITRRYRIAGPVERMLATPASSWARFVREALDKQEATMKEDDEVDDPWRNVAHVMKEAGGKFREERGLALPPPRGSFW